MVNHNTLTPPQGDQVLIWTLFWVSHIYSRMLELIGPCMAGLEAEVGVLPS